MHINKKDLIEFDNGNMNTQEVIEFLSHLDHCDFCLDQMMEQEDSSTAMLINGNNLLIMSYGILNSAKTG